jgi:hypothetical protein
VLLGLGDLVAAEDQLLRFMPNAVLRGQPQVLAAIEQDWRAGQPHLPERPPRLYARLQEFDRAAGSSPEVHWQFGAHNVPLGFDLGTLTGYNSLELRSVVDFARSLPLERVAAILGVQYLTSTHADSAAARFEPIYRQDAPPIVAYRLPPAREPVHAVRRVSYAPDPERMRARLSAPDFDPLEETVLLGDGPPIGHNGKAGDDAPELTPVAFGCDRVHVRVTMPDSAAIVLSEVAYPGWTVQVDGGPRRSTIPADGVVQAVLVPPGTHEVVFEFRSTAVRRGALISALAWLALALALTPALVLAGRAGSNAARAGATSTRPPSTGSGSRR